MGKTRNFGDFIRAKLASDPKLGKAVSIVDEETAFCDHLAKQGVVDMDDFLDLMEKKRKNPSITSIVWKGRYISLRLPQEGDGRKFDEMIAAGRGPALRTDVEFLKGSENGRQFQNDPYAGDFYESVAKKHGISTKGKKYLSQLAKFPGDPKAWVEGRGDIEKVCRERGWGSEGTVNVKRRERENPPQEAVPIDPAIVDREVANHFAGQTVKVREVKDAREKITDELTPKWKKKKRGK